jgi:opacity protein-like surface antigen
VVLLGLAVAGAATAGDFSRSGVYLGGGVSYGADLFSDEIEDAFGLPVDIDDTVGANARVGFRLLSFLALEAQYEWLSEYDIKIAGINAASLEQHTFTGNLKFYLPIWRIQPYLLAGIGIEQFELKVSLPPPFDFTEKDTALAGRLGGGLELYVTENLALFAEGAAVLSDQKVSLPGQDIEALHYASGQAGLLWRF